MKNSLVFVSLFFVFGLSGVFAQSVGTGADGIFFNWKNCNQTVFGKNAFVFDPSMDMNEIQGLIDSLHVLQTTKGSEFSTNRYALLFKPGVYRLDVRVGYYMHVMGLGNTPEDVIIIGAVRSNSMHGNHVLTNFWRAAENLTIIPTKDSINTWAVSQAAPLRSIYVKGNLSLHEGPSSGGFMANCKIDGTVFSGSQQQWFARNSEWRNWQGGIWNMMFVGVENAPKENWPTDPFTCVKETPLIREKPYWTYLNNNFFLKIPAVKLNSIGISWNNADINEKLVSIDAFYVAKPEVDNAVAINEALNNGRHILFTPGIYALEESLKITRSGTIIMGSGMATLLPVKGNRCLEVADVGGVIIAGLLIDAARPYSENLMQVGKRGSAVSHKEDPSYLYDVFFRVGGPHEGAVSNCLQINSSDVCVDHVWLWRADHGNGVGWEMNRCANGLIVNGNNVTIYGLFNEHFQEYQTIWNGENGRVYFYQSEMPYDPPAADSWKHGETYGYASYKVAEHVKMHQAWGVGIYNVFYKAPVIVDQAIETPEALEGKIYHKVIFWLNGNKESKVKSIINGKGGGVNSSKRKATMD
jgi:hypothetical protein